PRRLRARARRDGAGEADEKAERDRDGADPHRGDEAGEQLVDSRDDRSEAEAIVHREATIRRIAPAMQPLEFSSLTAPQLNAMAARDAIVIVPVGSTEQHGPHLPVMVDYRLATEVSRRGAEKLARAGHPVLMTPTVWTGFAEHHMELGGTITLDYAVFYGLIRGIVRSLARDGFRRIAVVNGHGGNIAPLTVAVSELTVELKIPL